MACESKKFEANRLVCKEEGELQIVYGEVYAPNRMDAHGEFMTAEEIRKAAHEFLRQGRVNQIDMLHDNELVEGCAVVESFIAKEDDTVFIPGSWVVGVHIPDPKIWGMVKKGELNGFSMEALVLSRECEREVEIPPVVTGVTSKNEDHEHKFFVKYSEKGEFMGGVTDTVDGHFHTIVAGTHTQSVQGHNHRFSSVDNIEIC